MRDTPEMPQRAISLKVERRKFCPVLRPRTTAVLLLLIRDRTGDARPPRPCLEPQIIGVSDLVPAPLRSGARSVAAICCDFACTALSVTSAASAVMRAPATPKVAR